jgi:dipeptidyl aminopeptidase/acylaminoacyl peptidase
MTKLVQPILAVGAIFIFVFVLLFTRQAPQNINPEVKSEKTTQSSPSSQPKTGQPLAETPNPQAKYFIESLKERSYGEGEIQLEKVLAEKDKFVSYLISYRSEGLKIYGQLNIPKSQKPYPIVILAHGYYNPETFTTGTGTEREAGYFANEGFLTIAPDFRGFGQSEDQKDERHLFRIDYTIDLLNLIASIKKTNWDFLDKEKIAIWGHSMGGGLAERAAVVSKDIKAVSLFGPVEADAWDDFNRFSVHYPEIRQEVIEKFGDKGNAGEFWAKVSPISYINEISAPFQIHHGTQDQTIPISASEKFHQALLSVGKKSEFFRYENQGHIFQGSTWQEAMKRTLKFYKEHLKSSQLP